MASSSVWQLTAAPTSPACGGDCWPQADRARRHAERWPVTYLAFDLLHLDGRSMRQLPYERRRELLLDLGLEGGVGWRTPRHFVGDSEPVLAATREHGLEGVVAKRLGSPYVPGVRNGAWIKHKHRRTESFLVTAGPRPGGDGPKACFSLGSTPTDHRTRR